jgi:hypothetical protein
MTFSIYDVATSGIALWSEPQTVAVSGGLYSVQLGTVNDFSGLTLDMMNGRWLGIQVGSDTEMTPRYPLTGTPYARTALTSDLLDGLHASAFAAAVHAHDASSIVSGVLAPGVGGTGVTGSGGVSHFLRADGAGGWASGPILAGDLPASGSPYLKKDDADTSVSSFSGFMYTLTNNDTSPAVGALRGVAGATAAANGDFCGLRGESNVGDNANDGIGVYNRGLYGKASGVSTASGTVTTNYGVVGEADGLSFGNPPRNIGVYGSASGIQTGFNCGVYGYNNQISTPNNYAGYFDGNVNVTNHITTKTLTVNQGFCASGAGFGDNEFFRSVVHISGYITFDGPTWGSFITSLVAADSTANRTITLPDTSGTVVTTGNLADITAVGTVASGTWNGSTIATSHGGTGTTTLGPAGAIAYSSGSAYAFTAAGTSGQILYSGGTGAPVWGDFIAHTHDASAIASGTLPAARGGTGVSASGGLSHYLRGDGSGGWISSAIPAADLPPGSSQYIQNQTAVAQSAGFSVSGPGTIGGALAANSNVTLGNVSANTVTVNGTIQGASPLRFEGATANGSETIFAIADPSADNTITFPDTSGTVITTGNLSQITAVETVTTGTWNGTALVVGYGGTGATSVGGTGTVAYSTGTAYAFSATGTAGQVLLSGGTGVPTWGNANAHTHDAAAIASGTLPASRGGTGLSASGGASQYLRGDGSGGWTSSAIQAGDIPSGSTYYLAKDASANTTSTASYAGDLYTLTNNSTSNSEVTVLRATVGAATAARGNFHGLVGISSVSDNVIAYPVTNYGVQGIAEGTSTGNGSTVNYGIHGSASGGDTNYAGYFVGNVHVAGTLSKTTGSFKIDHPLDPDNKTLSHSFVESPDMKNIYDGVAELDAKGEATITLPDWFEALNRDFRYQLTAIGAPAPGLHIASEISGNQFTIAGGRPGLKVSWQVTGTRQDPCAVKHPIVVEEEKAPHDRGKYLTPDAYGLPPEMGIGHVPAVAGKR